ncbi:MAG: ABC transporter ATP-binding protein [Candidatus Yonathbacteria bacterium]|nr:ABC transporter ATP-binding protein [Candidatus Yonathbacteria bacterium]
MRKKFSDSFKGWGILWKYVSKYEKELTTLSFLGVASALLNGTIPYVAGKFFDVILSTSSVFVFMGLHAPLWVAMLVLWGAIQLFAVVVDWTSDVRNEVFGIRVFRDYKVNAFSRLLLLPIAFHKERKIGEIMDGISRAGDGVYSISRQVVIALAPKFFSIAIGLSFAFYMNVSLTVVLILGILSYVFVIMRLVPKAIPLDRGMGKQYGKAYAIAYEATGNVSMVKQFTAESFEAIKTKESFEKADNLWVSLSRVWSNLNFSSRAIVFAVQLIIFILSVFAIQAGMMTLGELLAFNAYSAMVFGPFVTLGQNWQTLQNGLVALERAETIISLPAEEYEPKGSVVPKATRGAIEFKNVSFGYKKGNQVLHGVSFTAEPGQMVALVGESGAGKSTLIDLVSAYYFPSKGDVLVDGVKTNKWNLNALREMIAIVPQEVSLFNDTIEKNLAYGPKRHTKAAITRAVHEAHADAFIEKFPKKYAQVVGERGVKLSVGQKQRIAIARAILRNPKILILDEPTSALDSETEKYVTEALDRVMAGRTTFVIAHRLSTVRKADKILVLEGGKIIESGTHDELMAIVGGSYRHRYELHVGLV